MRLPSYPLCEEDAAALPAIMSNSSVTMSLRNTGLIKTDPARDRRRMTDRILPQSLNRTRFPDLDSLCFSILVRFWEVEMALKNKVAVLSNVPRDWQMLCPCTPL